MRRYTVSEARALLPAVIPVLREVQRCYAALRARRVYDAAVNHGASGDGQLLDDPFGGPDAADSVDATMARLRSAAARLDDWGVQVKDPGRGLIDFYSERDGTLVYLCYLLGEPDIQFWHPIDGGFAARQPIEPP